jgi:hypothetical protein
VSRHQLGVRLRLSEGHAFQPSAGLAGKRENGLNGGFSHVRFRLQTATSVISAREFAKVSGCVRVSQDFKFLSPASVGKINHIFMGTVIAAGILPRSAAYVVCRRKQCEAAADGVGSTNDGLTTTDFRGVSHG